MTQIELNYILYYADFLSLKHANHPVTDNCKYFFIHEHPINSAYILDLEPEYDPDNQYIAQAMAEYQTIQEKFDGSAAMSFIDDICFIRACGMVDAERMLQHIHMFSTKQERKQAFQEYKNWKKQNFHTHKTFDEDGNPQETRCTTYVKHAEILLNKRNLPKITR